MTAFMAGVIFGTIFTGAAFIAFLTRSGWQEREREVERWEDPFVEPPVFEPKSTITKRHYSL